MTRMGMMLLIVVGVLVGLLFLKATRPRIIKSTDGWGHDRCVWDDMDGHFVMWAPKPDGSCQ